MQRMNWLTITSLFVAISSANLSQAETVYAYSPETLKDPRRIPTSLVLPGRIESQNENQESNPNLHQSILIIHWMPSPRGEMDVYQIGGVQGYHSLETAKRFLQEFYASDFSGPGWKPNLVICGNNWGCGVALTKFLEPISKKQDIKVFYVGGWAFKNVELQGEPDRREQLITEAFNKASQ